jgi:N-dimethylarginine dimethylaminohydrolase
MSKNIKFDSLKDILLDKKVNIETFDCDVCTTKCLVHSPSNTVVLTPNQDIEEYMITSGYDIHTMKSRFGGQRDVIFSHNSKHIWIGSGYHTSDSTIETLKTIFDATIHKLKLKDDILCYLDTCFCPLNNNKLLMYSNSFDDESLCEIKAVFDVNNIIEVSRKDALGGVCNALSIDNNVLMNKPSWALIDDLDSHDINIESCKLSYDIKSSVLISQV